MSSRTAILTKKNRLDAVFYRVSNLPEDDLQVRSDLACYLCVLVSGFVESTVSDIAATYCRVRSSPTVMNYIALRLSRTGTLNTERLLQFVGSFDPNWRDQLDDFVIGERKDALDSVVANRHNIAHGESVGLTYMRIKNYYKRICEVVDFVDDMFN